MRKILRTVLLCTFTLLAAPVALLAQEKTISGTVTDESGETLPGVSVTAKGTKVGVLTNPNGKYLIKLPEGARTLVFSYIGQIPKEVNVGVQTTINVSLKSDTKALSEVVVVGYGEAKRANLTTAQTTVTAKDLDRTVNTTIEQALQGRSAGVYITQNSGQPGGGISVNIRGINTLFGSNEPLYVIDGIQTAPGQVAYGAQSSANPLSGINPSDIEDIQVLQGPSATAIYGSRAANGVLLITTKRGKLGDVKISYNYRQNIQTAPKRLNVMTLTQYAQMVKEFHSVAGGNTPVEFLDPSLLGVGTDWQSALFKNTPMSSHNLSLNGGTEKTKYYISGDYLDQRGVAAGSGFKRASFRVNLENKPKEWITFGTNLNYRQTNEVLTSSQENVIQNALQLTPQVPVKNIDGTWGGGDENNGANEFAPVNPVAIASLTTNTQLRREFTGDVRAAISILKDLSFRTSFSTNLGFSNSQYYRPKYKIGWAQNATAAFDNGSNNNTYWNFNQLLEYKKTINNHSFLVMASHESQYSNWRNLSGGRTGFLTDDVFDVSAGDALTATNSGGSDDWSMESYLGRLNYSFADKYIFTGTFRADGSVNFGDNNKWGVFPSASAAWRVSKEDFFKVPAISELKLRFETGVTGNSGYNKGAYGSLAAAPAPGGTGFLLDRYGNPDLKWEETKTNNWGLNIGLFKNRVEIEADYYVKNTDNLLMDAFLPWYMGSNGTGSIRPPVVNAGAIKTTGWGVTVNTTNINTKNFKWSSNINASQFESKVKSLNTDNGMFERVSWWMDNWTQRTTVGEAPWLFRGYIEEGLFQSIDEINASALPVDNNGNELPVNEATGIWVGDVKYKDMNDDGKITILDQTTIGNPWPKLFGGFSNDFSYKGFNLGILITGTYGNDVYNYTARVNSNPNNINLSRNLLTNTMDYAKPMTGDDGTVSLANPGTNVARISYGPNGNYSRFTNKFVEDGSYIRLKNVSLTYNFPSSLISKQKLIRGAKIMVSVQNVATITGYSGFDPEVGSYVGRDSNPNNQAVGLDNGRYPLTRMYSFGLGCDF